MSMSIGFRHMLRASRDRLQSAHQRRSLLARRHAAVPHHSRYVGRSVGDPDESVEVVKGYVTGCGRRPLTGQRPPFPPPAEG
jgi:hypothetical protein